MNSSNLLSKCCNAPTELHRDGENISGYVGSPYHLCLSCMKPCQVTEAREGKLLPCPFCGKQPELVRRDVEPQGDPWYGKNMQEFILCECGVCLFDGSFHEGFYDAKTRAVEAWNTRKGQTK